MSVRTSGASGTHLAGACGAGGGKGSRVPWWGRAALARPGLGCGSSAWPPLPWGLTRGPGHGTTTAWARGPGPECCGPASDTGLMTVPSPVPPPGVPGERLVVSLSPAEKDRGHQSHRGPAPHCVDGETEGPGRGTSVRSQQLCSCFSSGAGKFGRLQGWLRRVFCRLRIHPGIPRKPQQTWVFCFVSFCFVFCCQRKVLWTFCINRTRNIFKTFVFN